LWSVNLKFLSMQWHCWLGDKKGIQLNKKTIAEKTISLLLNIILLKQVEE